MVKPDKLETPRDRLKDLKIIFDGTKVTNENFYSVASFKWDDNLSLGIRWNGHGDESKGYPTIYSHSTWFVLPKEMYSGVIGAIMKYELEDNALELIKEILK